ncbi:hypothetical protein [Halalkalibacter flavus]
MTNIHYLTDEEKRVWRERLEPVYQKHAHVIGKEIMNEVLKE